MKINNRFSARCPFHGRENWGSERQTDLPNKLIVSNQQNPEEKCTISQIPGLIFFQTPFDFLFPLRYSFSIHLFTQSNTVSQGSQGHRDKKKYYCSSSPVEIQIHRCKYTFLLAKIWSFLYLVYLQNAVGRMWSGKTSVPWRETAFKVISKNKSMLAREMLIEVWGGEWGDRWPLNTALEGRRHGGVEKDGDLGRKEFRFYLQELRSHQTFLSKVQFSSVQSLSRVRLFATPWIAAHQASLSITNSGSSLRLTSIESVMPSSHLILCCPLLLLPPIPPSIRVFSNESTLHMRWPKYWSFSLSKVIS